MSEYKFLNPYNFVRSLPDNKGKDVDKPDVKLLGRCAPPPHDRFIGLTGKITCELTAETPLFISDSEFVMDHGNGHKAYRFFRLDNNGKEEHAIPSTSLRGMLRSVFEAVTNSCFSVFEGEKRLSYRLEPQIAKSLVPGRLEKTTNGDWQLRLLPGTTQFKPAGPQPNDCLYSAWIKRYRIFQRSETEKQNPTSPYSHRSIIELPFKHKDKCYALLEKIEHPARRTKRGKIIEKFYFWNVKDVAGRIEDLSITQKDQRIEEGFLCITNQNIENKHDERFFFRAKDNNSLPEKIQLPKDVLEKYKLLINDYKDRHLKDIEKIKDRGEDPSKATAKRMAYSRFIIDNGHGDNSLEGELVYAKLNRVPPNLSIDFIVPVTVSRLQYERTLNDILGEFNNSSNLCEDYDNLCPACRVFGWVDQNPQEDAKKVSYAGRVKISHAKITKSEGILDELPLAILSTPKPTTTFFYLLKNGKPDFNVDYNSSEAQLRGRKFYRHQNVAKEQEFIRAGKKRDDQNRTIRDALKPGAKFSFDIEFENLAPVELGALLWSIEMEEGMFHKLGLAKPLGFGSIKLGVKKIEILKPKERYSSITDDGWKTVGIDKKRDWINIYKAAMKEKYNKDFDKLENIMDLKAILSSTELPVHYPRSSEIPDPDGRSFEWFMDNKRKGKIPLELAADDTKGFPIKF